MPIRSDVTLFEIERTLQSFAVNLTGNPTFSGILNQARGEKVEVVLQQTAAQPGNLTGAIVSVENRPTGGTTFSLSFARAS